MEHIPDLIICMAGAEHVGDTAGGLSKSPILHGGSARAVRRLGLLGCPPKEHSAALSLGRWCTTLLDRFLPLVSRQAETARSQLPNRGSRHPSVYSHPAFDSDVRPRTHACGR